MAAKLIYKREYVDQVLRLSKLGLTLHDIAAFLEVSVKTIYRWRLQYEEFEEAFNEGKAESDELVKKRLFQRAVGYEVPTEKIFIVKGKPVRVPTTEHVKPDVMAQFIWLKNRLPDEWKERRNDDAIDDKTIVVIKGGLPDE